MSSVREKFPYRSDSVVEFVAPVDVVNQNPLDNTNDGASASFKVYDPAKDSILSAPANAFDALLDVADSAVFQVQDSVELTLDDGNLHTSVVTAVDPAAGQVTIQDQTPSPAATGSRFRVIFGTEIFMSEYGTPNIDSKDYGFRGTLPDTHPVHTLDQEFNIEITVIGSPTGGLNLVDTICGVIKPRGECDCK